MRAARSRFSFLSCIAASWWLSACNAYPAKIHQDFAAQQPAAIGVPAVENRTLVPNLDRYPTGGVVQRAFFGAGEVDVLALFQASGRQSLRERGYHVVQGSSSEAAPAAELRIRLLNWKELPQLDSRGLSADFEVELVKLPAATTLYHRAYVLHVNRGGRPEGPLTPAAIERGIAAALRGALHHLPLRDGAPTAPPVQP
jgi:hypothetical protein